MNVDELLALVSDARIETLHNFWAKARGISRYPAQDDLDLMKIPRLLPEFFIVDAEEGPDFRYRYLGSAIDNHLGQGCTGMLFSEVRSGRVLHELLAFFSRIVENGEMGIITTRLPSERQKWLVYRRAILPVADDHENINKVIGVFVFDSEITFSTEARTVLEAETDEGGQVETHFAALD